MRKVLDRYFDAMRTAIERHGGTVEKFIGDAVVGAFGVPEAHEDDALRAVRAALEMRRAAAELDGEIDDAEVRMLVRIAIDCGEAFADAAAATQGRIVADAFNTAARLQAAAAPGEILVSAAAEPMLRGRVELAPLDPIGVKGKAEPLRVHRVLGVRPTPSRAETPLVGRDRHLTVLRQALEDAIDASACVLVTVLAPPGVGKSRLAAAFADAVRDHTTVLIGQTPSYGDGVTFAPLVELLAEAAGQPGGDAEQVATALRARCADQPDGAAVGDRLAHVLGVGEALASDASWAVRRLFEVMAAERPLVVVLEDMHWAEQPMLDLADAVIERVHGPVLVLCLARPELLEQRPTWAAGKPRALTTTLPPLSPEDARRVAELLLGPQAPSPSSTGSARRPRGTLCTWSSSRRCLPIRGSSSTAGGWAPTIPRWRSLQPCRPFSPHASIASSPHRASCWSAHRSRDAGSGSPRSARSLQTSVRKTSRTPSPHSSDEVSSSLRMRPPVDGASRTRSSSKPRIEVSPRSYARICTCGWPTG